MLERFRRDQEPVGSAWQTAQLIETTVLEIVSGDELRDVPPSRPGFASSFEDRERPFIACFCEANSARPRWD